MRFRVFGGLQLPEYGFVRPPRALPPPYHVHLVVADGVPTREDAVPGADPDSWARDIIPRGAIVREAMEQAGAEASARAMAKAGPSPAPAILAQAAVAAAEAATKEKEHAHRTIKEVPRGGEAWLEYGVEWPCGTKPLNPPDAADILLNKQFSLPSGWLLDVQFPQETEPNPVCFLSEPYPKPGQNRQALWGRRVGVSHYGEYTLRWTRAEEPKIDALLAISFEGFAANRRSADCIARVTPGRLFGSPDL
jgi:hypothetical protein